MRIFIWKKHLWPSDKIIEIMNRINKERAPRLREGFCRKYTVSRMGSSWVPKIDSRSTDGVLKMCCFVAHFRLYADVTSKIRQIGNAVFLPERVRRRKSPWEKEDIDMLLIISHIKKGGCISFIRVYILELLLKSDCNTPLTYLINI